jgi:transposase, IS5 family
MAQVKLEDILDKSHGLYQLANRLNWDFLINELGPYYAEDPGRPEIPIRVIVGLHYLKYLENESDEGVVEKFCENPYWQYFCGLETFQQKNWRERGRKAFKSYD